MFFDLMFGGIYIIIQDEILDYYPQNTYVIAVVVPVRSRAVSIFMHFIKQYLEEKL